MITKPMLAWKLTTNKQSYPCYVQPKLNGIRACWSQTDDLLVSRELETWLESVLPSIHRDLRRLNINLITDGELYLHGLSLQQINSIVAVNRITPHKDAALMQYHIFDFMSNQPFTVRQHWLHRLQARIDSLSITTIRTVQTDLVTSQETATALYEHYKNTSWEGTMHRDPDSPYGFSDHCTNKDNRWNYLLKRKGVEDITCIITGYKEGKKRNLGRLGSFVLMTPDGVEFDCGGGLTDAQRISYWKSPPPQGTEVRVLFDEYSDALQPLRARIDCVYTQEL